MSWLSTLKTLVRKTDPDAIFIKDFDDALVGIQNTVIENQALIAVYDLNAALDIMQGKTGKNRDECLTTLIEFIKTIPVIKRPCLITVLCSDEDDGEIEEIVWKAHTPLVMEQREEVCDGEIEEEIEAELLQETADSEIDPDWKLQVLDKKEEAKDPQEIIESLKKEIAMCKAIIAEHIYRTEDVGTETELGSAES